MTLSARVRGFIQTGACGYSKSGCFITLSVLSTISALVTLIVNQYEDKITLEQSCQKGKDKYKIKKG